MVIQIHIEKYGKPLSDYEAPETVKNLVHTPWHPAEPQPIFRFSNALVLDLFRAELIENIHIQQFEFYIDGNKIEFDDYMCYKNFPNNSILSIWDNTLERIINGKETLFERKRSTDEYRQLVQKFKDMNQTFRYLSHKVVDHYKRDPGKKIHALKLFRDVSGLGLRESKEWIDAAYDDCHGML